jgi:periplasmic divalent cation tolerance protein
MPLPLLVLTTVPADADWQALAEALVGEGLAACVNTLAPMDSVYSWKGKIERERERQVVIKTSPARLDALLARVQALHPYEVPELLVIRADGGGEAYAKWVQEVTREG